MTAILFGVLTFYAGVYVGCPLNCGGTYDGSHDWIAIDFSKAEGWHCSDMIAVWRGGKKIAVLEAKDSGPFMGYCATHGDRCHPIVGDLPIHTFWTVFGVRGPYTPARPLSVRALLVNESLVRRELLDRL